MLAKILLELLALGPTVVGDVEGAIQEFRHATNGDEKLKAVADTLAHVGGTLAKATTPAGE